MSKSENKNESSLQEMNEEESLIQAKILRFHPYYYMGRKGMYTNKEGKRFQIKTIKLQKTSDYIEIFFQERKRSGEKFTIKGKWDDVQFDYYSINSTSNKWQLKFSKK